MRSEVPGAEPDQREQRGKRESILARVGGVGAALRRAARVERRVHQTLDHEGLMRALGPRPDRHAAARVAQLHLVQAGAARDVLAQVAIDREALVEDRERNGDAPVRGRLAGEQHAMRRVVENALNGQAFRGVGQIDLHRDLEGASGPDIRAENRHAVDPLLLENRTRRIEPGGVRGGHLVAQSCCGPRRLRSQLVDARLEHRLAQRELLRRRPPAGRKNRHQRDAERKQGARDEERAGSHGCGFLSWYLSIFL